MSSSSSFGKDFTGRLIPRALDWLSQVVGTRKVLGVARRVDLRGMYHLTR